MYKSVMNKEKKSNAKCFCLCLSHIAKHRRLRLTISF